MDNKKTITIIILGLVAMAGILLFLFLPSKSHLANIDFYVYDTNDNFHYEVNERLELLVNDTAAIKGKRLIWEMGNGASPDISSYWFVMRWCILPEYHTNTRLAARMRPQYRFLQIPIAMCPYHSLLPKRPVLRLDNPLTLHLYGVWNQWPHAPTLR